MTHACMETYMYAHREHTNSSTHAQDAPVFKAERPQQAGLWLVCSVESCGMWRSLYFINGGGVRLPFANERCLTCHSTDMNDTINDSCLRFRVTALSWSHCQSDCHLDLLMYQPACLKYCKIDIYLHCTQ